MRYRGEIWRQRLWIWVPAVLFFLANAVAFSVYKLGYAGRVDELDDEIHAQQEQVRQLDGSRQQIEAMIARVRTNEEEVQHLYTDRLSTRSRRLTRVTKEIKDMAQQAGMVPRSFSYPEEALEDYGLIKHSFVFSGLGTYAELRRIIGLIEKSPSFISIEEVNVTGNAEGPELRIDLTLSTFFAMDAEDGGAAVPATPGPRRAAASTPGPPVGGER
jgi:cell division protein FtsB